MRNQSNREYVICERLRKLGYARERHIHLYGEEFDLVSNPIPDGDGFTVEGVARSSGARRRIRIPLPVVHTLTQEIRVDEYAEIAA